MSVSEPLPDPDDIFAGMMEGLDLEEPTDVVDVTVLNDKELLDLFEDTRQALLEAGEMLTDLDEFGAVASSQEGRELQSTRAACLIEMRKRGIG